MKRKALITGITGQDGAYLAEFLLKKGYEVHGIKRRSSLFNTDRIDHLYQDPHEEKQRFILYHGDMTDSSSLIRIIQQVQPDEIYNLAAQSHVQVSFEEPEYTANSDALGTLRILEAIRILKLEQKVRFYQASTSELYGLVQETPQTEKTPFYPRSPYAIAKLYAYWITVNYREAYGMYACNGILFNHECIASNTPLLVRTNNIVNVVLPEELVPLRRKGPNIQFFETPHLFIWDGQDWTPITGITATKRRKKDAEHTLLSVQARHGILDATTHHRFLKASFDMIEANQLQVGEQLALTERFPETPAWTQLTKEMAQFLGLMTANGYIPAKGKQNAQFTNNDENLRQVVARLWSQLFLGHSRQAKSPSGFSENTVGQLYLNGASTLIAWLREQLYSKHGLKRVPPVILNAPLETQAAYLEGYYAGDGLKAGKNESVKTNSTLLAQGLYWLYANQGRLSSVYLEQRNNHAYYQLNIPSSNILNEKGQHLCKEPTEIRRIDHSETANEWVFDLETKSGVFMAGVGRMVVHNSPIRGETFVTRKITRALARIKLGLQDCLYLGNLDAKRDWGHAQDYVKMQWLMLQQEQPEDFVIASGKQHSVRDFVNVAAAELGIKINWQGKGLDEKGLDEKGKCIVAVDPRYFRPTEVESLLGDPTKAKEKLGWEPQISFHELVVEMMREDLKAAKRDDLVKQHGFVAYDYHE
jgi:GDPmannose 4,6-dehydratase